MCLGTPMWLSEQISELIVGLCGAPDQVMEITGGAGVKAVIDGIGASTVDISIECLSRRGIFVTFGHAPALCQPSRQPG